MKLIATQLTDGLSKLGPTFNAHLCEVCKGHGRYEQTYTVGCGMGSYLSMGRCGWCSGKGVMQGREVAPESVINQIMTAGA